MEETELEKTFKDRRFKVLVPHVPYLPSDQEIKVNFKQVKDDEEFYKYIRLKIFPLDDVTYSFSEAVDVLEIFTSRWQHGRSDPWTEPYAKAVGDPEATFTLSELAGSKDAYRLLEKFCKNRKRKDGLGGKLFVRQDSEEEDGDDYEED
jgi:hypothetical protein